MVAEEAMVVAQVAQVETVETVETAVVEMEEEKVAARGAEDLSRNGRSSSIGCMVEQGRSRYLVPQTPLHFAIYQNSSQSGPVSDYIQQSSRL